MKFPTLSAFEKHFQSGFSSSGTFVYALAYQDKEERKKLLMRFANFLQKQSSNAALVKFMPKEHSFSSFIQMLNTRSLFEKFSIYILEDIDEISDKEFAILEQYLIHPSTFSYLFVGMKDFKSFSEIYQKTKKEVTVLDLSAEKPWDRQKRIEQEVMQKVLKEGKKMAKDALSFFLEMYGHDLTLLESEFLKLCCFCADKKEISLEDIETIGSSSLGFNSWSIAERIVWDKNGVLAPSCLDLSQFIALLSQVRYYFDIGEQIFFLYREKHSSESIRKALPSVREKMLEKSLKALEENDYSSLFLNGKEILFEIELLSKNSNLDPLLLFDLLVGKLVILKNKKVPV